MTNDRSPHRRTPHRDDDGAFTLDDLCSRGGVTVRTVRYYISEGLLPPPTGHGPNARYTREHLDRLLVIGMMKERFLPLREIRRALDGMTSQQIADTAEVLHQADVVDADVSPRIVTTRDSAPPAMSPPPQRFIREESTAADYIADVLNRDAPRQRPAYQATTPAPETEPASWKRIAISDEAELLIEEEAFNRRREQFESLVTWAKRILNGS